MTTWRQALRDEIAFGGVRVIQGTPPLRCQVACRNYVQLFGSTGSNVLPRQILLALLPNGDWSRREVEMYVGDASLSESDALSVVTNGLIYALAGVNYKTLMRSKWSGNELCVDQAGLLECVCALGSRTSRRFLWMHSGVSRLDINKRLSSALNCGPTLAAHIRTPALEMGSFVPGDEPMDGDEKPADSKDEQAWAQENARSRRMSGAFWAGDPLRDLVLARNCMQPVRLLMLSKVHVASEDWESTQQRNLASALNGSGAPAEREYRPCIAASNVHENECLGLIWTCMSLINFGALCHVMGIRSHIDVWHFVFLAT
jgi:hypothetical protein